jgi:serine acetyltransferase
MPAGCMLLSQHSELTSMNFAVQVAAGSLVLRDVPPKIMVAGSPARPVGKVSGVQAAVIVVQVRISTCQIVL